MREDEIRPSDLFRRYLELSREDVIKHFQDIDRIKTNCVACGANEIRSEFKKHGFEYGQCKVCGTLFLTPRPPLEAFEAFYENSISSNFWAEVFFPAVMEVRKEKIFQPRVDSLVNYCIKKGVNVRRLIDVGAGFGIFLDEWRKRYPNTEVIAVEPSISLANNCRAKNIDVVQSIVEYVDDLYEGFADLVVCFEVLEHVHDPVNFIKKLKRLAKPGGLVFVSTLCCDGFDIRTLWSDSDQICPPHHINFFSIRGFEHLFKQAGLTNIDITTPGKLDVDIVRNFAKRNPKIFETQPFLHCLIKENQISEAFQVFLEKNRLSSHAWVFGSTPI